MGISVRAEIYLRVAKAQVGKRLFFPGKQQAPFPPDPTEPCARVQTVGQYFRKVSCCARIFQAEEG